jgi:queuosine precursor transporter
LDSAVFISVAFWGTIPPAAITSSIVTQWLMKSVYEVIATPLTYAAVNYLKKVEGIDVFDRDTDFNPLKVAN